MGRRHPYASLVLIYWILNRHLLPTHPTRILLDYIPMAGQSLAISILQKRLSELEAEVQSLSRTVAELGAENKQLRAENTELHRCSVDKLPSTTECTCLLGSRWLLQKTFGVGIAWISYTMLRTGLVGMGISMNTPA